MIISQKKVKVSDPSQIHKIIRSIIDSENNEEYQEHFYVIGFNNKNVVQYVELISLGTVNEALVYPRDVFRTAIQKNCVSIAISHNHPSGNLSPSGDDLQTTRRLFEAGKILGITLLDHVIIAGDEFYSFKENGLIGKQEIE